MLNIFQCLENKKGKQIPFEYKIKNNLPLNESDLYVNGDLNLFKSNITYLPDNLKVDGYLDLFQSKIRYLPNNLTINGNLDMSYTEITSLPDNLIVNGWLYCYNTPLVYNIKKDWLLHEKYLKQFKGKIQYA